MTLKEKIQVIKECQKVIYDLEKRTSGSSTIGYSAGLWDAQRLLSHKRKRLQKKLRK